MSERERILRLHEIAMRELMKVRSDPHWTPIQRVRLDRVRFEWNRNMTRAAGNARRSGLIRLSIKIWTADDNDEAEFLNTVRHEIAHVIVGLGHGHDEVWREMALRLGCNGKQFHDLAVPERQRPKREHPWPCARCGEEMLLGPGQFRTAKYEGRQYVHRRCPTSRG